MAVIPFVAEYVQAIVSCCHVTRPFGVRPAAPQVDHLPAVDVRRDGRAELALLEAANERVGNRLEAGLDRPLDRRVRHNARRQTNSASTVNVGPRSDL